MRHLLAPAKAFLQSHPETPRYALIGILNTLVNAGVFNLFLFTTNITRGPLVPIFSLIAFWVSVVHSFFWNKFWVFKNNSKSTHYQLALFGIVTTGTALITSGVVHVVVNVIGAPPGFSPILWANVAIVVIIPVAFLCNFFGVKFLVFRKTDKTAEGQEAGQ